MREYHFCDKDVPSFLPALASHKHMKTYVCVSARLVVAYTHESLQTPHWHRDNFLHWDFCRFCVWQCEHSAHPHNHYPKCIIDACRSEYRCDHLGANANNPRSEKGYPTCPETDTRTGTRYSVKSDSDFCSDLTSPFRKRITRRFCGNAPRRPREHHLLRPRRERSALHKR